MILEMVAAGETGRFKLRRKRKIVALDMYIFLWVHWGMHNEAVFISKHLMGAKIKMYDSPKQCIDLKKITESPVKAIP